LGAKRRNRSKYSSGSPAHPDDRRHPVYLSLGNHLLDARMRCGGQQRAVGADADERVDIEKKRR